MKTILKLSAIVAFMFTSAVGMANEEKLSIVADESAKSLVFKLEGQSGQTSVKIVDANQNIIFSESFKKEGDYNKKFDFKYLESGVYSLKMENDLKVIEYTLNVMDDTLKVVDRKESAKPVFRAKGDKVFLNLLNLGQKDVAIKVYDSSYRVVYSETLTDTLLVEKAFNFESAKKDSYTVVVKDNNNTYYKDIIVD
jgi:hypothetical protein